MVESKQADIQRWEQDAHNHGNNNFTKLLKDHYASDVRKNQGKINGLESYKRLDKKWMRK